MIKPREEWFSVCAKLPPRGSLVRLWDEYAGKQWTEYWDRSIGSTPAHWWWKETGIERMKDDG